jgi:hypothetical protein
MRGLARRLRGSLLRASGLAPARELAKLPGILRRHEATSPATKAAQIALVQQYRSMRHRGDPLPALDAVELRVCSQNGEDGILLYVFALIGSADRRVVEICAGDGIQCNAANLILNHGWSGLLVDGDAGLVARGREFYAAHPDTFSFPPRLVHAWVTRENVNDLLHAHGFVGDVDLLSLDLDGVDYWIWEAIDAIHPRVLVAETQCLWGAERSVTVPYRPDFRSPLVDGFGIYSGGSLPAFVKLGRRKGYRLVGCQSLGFNAFFVRDGIGEDVLPEVTAERCLQRPFVEWAMRELQPLVADREWVEV